MVTAVTMFIPRKYVPPTEAVIEAFVIRHSDEISTAGLKSDEAKQIAAYWLARARLKAVEFHAQEGTRAARRGNKLTGVVPRQRTHDDLAMAKETPEIKALSEKGMALKPLLKTTWDDLRSRLSAGEIIGYLVEPGSGKIYKIDAHQWNRDDADVAHITGWFSIPHAWGRFAGPVALVRSDLQQTVIRQRWNHGLTARTQLDRCLAPVQDDAVAKENTTGTKPRSF